jgi:hypothetical protein
VPYEEVDMIWRSALLVGFLVSLVRADSFVWWEGESPAKTNFPATSWFAPQNADEKDKLSGGAWLGISEKRKAGAEASFAEYTVDVPQAGKLNLWTRKFWKHGPFRWRFDQGDWQTCGPDVALADSVELRLHLAANWVYLGNVDLTAGRHTFRLELLAREGADQTACFDAFLLTPTAFFPAGKLKPGEKTGLAEPGRFSVEPAPDDFRNESVLDLRWMNEPVAGEKGYVRRDGDKLRLGSGPEARFFAVNVNSESAGQSRDSVDYLARRLAKLGVNMVRYHAPMFDSDLATINAKRLDDFQYLVAAMKKQGIYTHLSIYFPLWVNVKPADGIEGFDTIQNKHPFGLIFFDPELQSLHRGWLKQILTAPSPYAKTDLAHEPALASVELVNEDSLFFHTFSKQNIPDVQWKKLEARFGGPILPAWDMSSDGIKAGGAAKLERMRKQVKFLADLQRSFYADTTAYVKKDLGFGGLVVASNWITADPATLNPIERWTYTACDIIDKHGYFSGKHEGDGASFTVRVGNTYTDRSGVDSISSLPVHMIQEKGFPSMISEIGWSQPNRYRAEFAPLVAAYASMQGIDNVALFAMGSNFVRDTGMNKFQLASPAVAMTFPAAAIMYRRRDVAEAPATYIQRSDADLFALDKPMPSEARALDELRKTAEERGTGAAGVTGHLVHTTDAPPKPSPAPPQPLRMLEGQRVLLIDTPRTRGAIGFVGKAGKIQIGRSQITCGNDYAVILVTSLDGKAIDDSRKVLVTIMTDDHPYGFKADNGKITSLGQFPFTVANIDATVSVGWPPDAPVDIRVLDENGNARGVGAAKVPADGVYSVWSR